MSLTALNRDANTTVGFAVESCSLGMVPWCTGVTESDPASVIKGDQVFLTVFIVLVAVHSSWDQTMLLQPRGQWTTDG